MSEKRCCVASALLSRLALRSHLSPSGYLHSRIRRHTKNATPHALIFFSAVAASGEAKTKLAMLPKNKYRFSAPCASSLHLDMLVEISAELASLVNPLLPSHVNIVLLGETLQVVCTFRIVLGWVAPCNCFCW
ncbi:hypothetical protein LI328DRAFT_168100 [Trichoderma asperelloides]|nr:hypothetical protein LI328DRAFT_168100 [Trichoderma asperelloides]